MVVKLSPRAHSTQFPCNIRLSHQRIVTFLIIVPYKYSYLFTGEFLVDKYQLQLYGTTPTNYVVRIKILITRPRML